MKNSIFYSFARIHEKEHKVEVLKIDKRTLPRDKYTDSGFESRQVVDFDISICVTEYRAQVLIGSDGKRYVAPFPDHVKRPIQYGPKAKASAVYMSQFQLIPYARIVDYFSSQVDLNVSQGSLFNFNKEAYEALENFEEIAKSKLISSTRVNVDETGININGKRLWFTQLAMINGHTATLMLSVEVRPWMLLGFYLTLMVCFVMTIGNPIINMVANMRCVTHIICVNWNGQLLKTSKSGLLI